MEFNITFDSKTDYVNWKTRINDYLSRSSYSGKGRDPKKGLSYTATYYYGSRDRLLKVIWEYIQDPSGKGELKLTLDGYVTQGLVRCVKERKRVYEERRRKN